MKVAELKEALQQRNLKMYGKKRELVARSKAALLLQREREQGNDDNGEEADDDDDDVYRGNKNSAEDTKENYQPLSSLNGGMRQPT